MNDLSDITAVVLAGGLGTRLRSVVADRPKVLAKIKGRPFLYFILDQLVSTGIRSAVLCTGYLGEQVHAEFGSSYRSLTLWYSQEPNPLGTAGGLRLALPQINSESVLVLNGDSYCDAKFDSFWAFHRRQKSLATMLLTRVPNTDRYGRVDIDPSNNILRFQEKTSSTGSGWINAGAYLIQLGLLQAIPPARALSLERDIFPAWVGKGFYGYPSDAPFIDIGTPESLVFAEDFFASTASGA